MKAVLMRRLQFRDRPLVFVALRRAVVPEELVFHEADAFALDGVGDHAGGLPA